MEDLLSVESGSKAFLEELLQETPVPTLWTSESLLEVSPAALRRMAFAIELPSTPGVRTRLWGQELARHGVAATPENAESLAREFDVLPSVASGAIAAAGLCGGDLDSVRLGVRSLFPVVSERKGTSARESTRKDQTEN